jgi:hypothetical protein
MPAHLFSVIPGRARFRANPESSDITPRLDSGFAAKRAGARE